MKIASSHREVRVIEGSSYRESTVQIIGTVSSPAWQAFEWEGKGSFVISRPNSLSPPFRTPATQAKSVPIMRTRERHLFFFLKKTIAAPATEICLCTSHSQISMQ